jgi:hypothetical protein
MVDYNAFDPEAGRADQWTGDNVGNLQELHGGKVGFAIAALVPSKVRVGNMYFNLLFSYSKL